MDDKETKAYVLDLLAHKLSENNKRWFIFSLVMALMFFFSNAFWICRELQYNKEVCIEQEIENEEGVALVNGIGDLSYGPSETEDNSKTSEKDGR